jgi:hypothetical protein
MSPKRKKIDVVSRPTDLLPHTDNTSSSVWQYFHVSKQYPEYAWCIVKNCRPQVQYVKRFNGSTTALHRHLRSYHKHIQLQPDKSTISIRDHLTSMRKPGLSKAQQSHLDNLLTRFIISSCSSFNLVENEDFLILLNALSDHQYIPLGRTRLTEQVDSLYKQMIDVLMQDMKKNSISITCDAAVLLNGESYLALTAHYITESWEMKEIVLSIYHMQEHHTGEYVSDLLDRISDQWECSDRLFGAVTDNGANFVKAIRINEKIEEQFRCTVHTLQLALKDALSDNDDFDTLCKESRDIVNKIRSSSTLRNALREEQQKEIDAANDAYDTYSSLPTHVYSLITDVATRFNSMCMVFERVLKLKHVLQTLCREQMEISLSTSQWDSMSEYSTTLALVREVSVGLETSLTPSLGLACARVSMLLEDLSKAYMKMQIPSCRTFCASTRQHIYDRLSPSLSQDATALSLMLDPRVRTKKIPGYNISKAQDVLRRKHSTFDLFTFIGVEDTSSSSSSSSSDMVLEGKESVVDEMTAPKRPRQALGSEFEETQATSLTLPEIDRYLQEPGIKLEECALQWWKCNCSKYPTLAQMARVYLALPASSAPAERVFSVGTLVLNAKRRKLLPDRVSRLMLMKYNMKVYRKLKGCGD